MSHSSSSSVASTRAAASPDKTGHVNIHLCSLAIVSMRRSVALLPLEVAFPLARGAAMDAPPSPSVAACPEGPGASGLTDAEAGSWYFLAALYSSRILQAIFARCLQHNSRADSRRILKNRAVLCTAAVLVQCLPQERLRHAEGPSHVRADRHSKSMPAQGVQQARRELHMTISHNSEACRWAGGQAWQCQCRESLHRMMDVQSPTMTGCTHAASFICGLSPQFPANMSKVRLRCCRVSALILRGSCKPPREVMK